MTLTTLAVIGLAFSLDILFGEPPTAFHPVAWFGRLVDGLDRQWSTTARRQRLVGVGIAAAAPLVPATVAGATVIAAAALNPMAEGIAAALVLYSTTSLRSLLELTANVVRATDGDGARARELVVGLVGRDVSTLSPRELRSAALESAAENLADGLVASLLAFSALAPISLPVAAAVAAWIKGVNTLDSMLGYPSKPIGTASARLDDLVMYLAARIAAVTIAVAAANPLVLRRAGQWARVPPSPNSGWPMATLACAMDVRLEKPSTYVLNSEAELPTLAEGERGVALVTSAAIVSVLVAVGLAIVASTAGTTLESQATAIAEVMR
ncbi:CobD/CbiB family cobalamin biosynthesis protein [Natrinema gelatinilyticum]|uniref:CobD/CbiB family cobalamin biosynthesis protein n=1 Tax=Natrinema gelatinilyticum TaxID=2961571 RepID=UPI0020C38095|nr:CobD/CbiB family cobalamin biosynthesis protein [Natrinema gelatinilyticum]